MKRDTTMESYYGLLLFVFAIGAFTSAFAGLWLLKRHLYIEPFFVFVFVACVGLFILTSAKFQQHDIRSTEMRP